MCCCSHEIHDEGADVFAGLLEDVANIMRKLAPLPPQSDLDRIVPCTVATVAGREKEDNEQCCASEEI